MDPRSVGLTNNVIIHLKHRQGNECAIIARNYDELLEHKIHIDNLVHLGMKCVSVIPSFNLLKEIMLYNALTDELRTLIINYYEFCYSDGKQIIYFDSILGFEEIKLKCGKIIRSYNSARHHISFGSRYHIPNEFIVNSLRNRTTPVLITNLESLKLVSISGGVKSYDILYVPVVQTFTPEFIRYVIASRLINVIELETNQIKCGELMRRYVYGCLVEFNYSIDEMSSIISKIGNSFRSVDYNYSSHNKLKVMEDICPDIDEYGDDHVFIYHIYGLKNDKKQEKFIDPSNINFNVESLVSYLSNDHDGIGDSKIDTFLRYRHLFNEKDIKKIISSHTGRYDNENWILMTNSN